MAVIDNLYTSVMAKVGADTVQVFGDTGSLKTVFALRLVQDARKLGHEAIYIDTEKNIKDKPEGMAYVYLSSWQKSYDFVFKQLPRFDYKAVVLDSLGLPILGEFAQAGLREKGNVLLQAEAMSYALKQYAQAHDAVVLVTNQPESAFNKDKAHELRPFGDKAQFFFKELWKTTLDVATADLTRVRLWAFRSRFCGRYSNIYTLEMGKNGLVVSE